MSDENFGGKFPATSAVSLHVDRLEVVRGQKRLFSGLSFDVGPGRLLVVRGANGSGKTSLIRTLAGLASPEGGAVVWRDASSASRSGSAASGSAGESYGETIEDSRARIAYVAHHPAIHPVFTVSENLRSGLELQRRTADGKDADGLFHRLGLPARLPAAKLSQGQLRRLALAQLSLAVRPAWLLDEPLTALDDAAVGWFREALTRHLDAGGLCVMSLHQSFEWQSGRSEVLRLARRPPAGPRSVEARDLPEQDDSSESSAEARIAAVTAPLPAPAAGYVAARCAAA